MPERPLFAVGFPLLKSLAESPHRSKNPAAAIGSRRSRLLPLRRPTSRLSANLVPWRGARILGEFCSTISCWAPQQITMAGTGASAIGPGEKSNFHTALEECLPSGHDIAIGDRSSVKSSMEPKSEYFSTRVEEMMRSKSQFSSDVEHEIAHSTDHWSELLGLSSELSEDKDHEEEVIRENREVFAELMNDPQWENHEQGHFFMEWTHILKLDRKKIAEGGQGAIFEVSDNCGTNVLSRTLLKVFKRGLRLADLKKQWPLRILRREVLTCVVHNGVMLEDGRFAFMMLRCWGDLRKLIDQAMQEKNNQGPPFPYEWNGQTLDAKYITLRIASGMKELHKQGIIHRDLKAANVLLWVEPDQTIPTVADYECSIGVVGTRFWRAPEILLALKHGSALDFSEKVDVYSYGMTCFEVVTGRLPFEGELEDCRESRDLVIGRRRPKLPSDLDLPLKDLVERCWNPIPNERPSFEEIFNILGTL